MTSSQKSPDSEPNQPQTEPNTNVSTETNPSSVSSEELASGYTYVAEEEAPVETNEIGASESLTRQLLRNGDTFDKKKLSDRLVVPGAAVGGIKGFRATDAEPESAKKVLPYESRTTELSRGESAQRNQNKKFPLVAALVAGLTVVAGGVTYALVNSSHESQPVSSTSTEANPSQSPSPSSVEAIPSPSIVDRVPEVKYVDPTDVAVEPGTVQYVETQQAVEQPPVIEAPTPIETTASAPAEVVAPVATPEPTVTVSAPAPVASEVQAPVPVAPTVQPTLVAPEVQATTQVAFEQIQPAQPVPSVSAPVQGQGQTQDQVQGQVQGQLSSTAGTSQQVMGSISQANPPVVPTSK